MLGFIFFIVIVILAIWGYVRYKQYKHFMAIKPANVRRFDRVSFSSPAQMSKINGDADKFVNYIAKDVDKKIMFPESKTPAKTYYLTQMSFSPDIDVKQTAKGHTGSALAGGLIAGPVGAVIGASRKKKIKTETTEHKAKCYMNFITTDLKDTFTVVIMCKTDQYNLLSNSYMLNNIELKKLENKINQLDNSAKAVEDNSNKDVNSRLENLKHLLDNDLINEQDFEAKKKQILGI